MTKNKKKYLMSILLIMFVVAGIGITVYFNNIESTKDKKETQYEVIKYEYTDGYMKISSKIIDKDFKEGAVVNASLEDLKEVVLQSGDLNYTCEVAKSADENQIRNSFSRICASGDEAVQNYLDDLIKNGTVMFYKKGILEKGNVDKDFRTVESNGDTTTIIFGK